MKLQDKLVQELRDNEHVVQIVDAEDLKKEWEAIKGDVKDASGYVSPIKDSAAAIKIIRELGVEAKKVALRNYAGKQYIIFKGHAGNRKILTGTRYLTSNTKVVRMAVGSKGVIRSVKGGFVLTAVLSVGIEIFDAFINDTKTMSEL